MKAVILKCKPGSRFHLGQSGRRPAENLSDTSEIIHSDVLFGAYINMVAILHPDKIAYWKEKFESGDIRISSAFYCIERGGKFIYLFPKPISLNAVSLGTNQVENALKTLKKIRFVSKGVWEQEILPEDWLSGNKCFLPESRAVCLKEEFEGEASSFFLSQKQDTQKVKVRTDADSGKLYTQTDLVIMGNDDAQVHWYFLLDSEGLSDEDAALAELLFTHALAMGIGGERSTGCGAIEEVVFDPDFNLPQNGGESFVCFSLTIPKSEDENFSVAYQVLPRGGMYYGNDEKDRIKYVNAMAEGAVFSQRPEGSIADLSTDHRKHLRYGKAFPVALPKPYELKEEL